MNWQRFPIIFCAFFTATLAHAAVSVSPSILELESFPGGMQTFSFTIHNSAGGTLNCALSTYAMRITGDGLPTPSDSAPRTCREWITFKEPGFRVDAGQEKRVLCELRCPREAAGGYYALIAVDADEGLGEADMDRGAGGGVSARMRFKHRSYVVVMLTIKGGRAHAIVEPGMPVFQPMQDGRSVRLAIPVRNRGDIHTRISGNAEVQSAAGQPIGAFELAAGRGFLLPEHERLLQTNQSLNLTDGLYTARVSLYEAGRHTPMTAQFPFRIENGEVLTDAVDAETQNPPPASPGFIIKQPFLEFSLRPGASRREPLEVVNLTREMKSIRLEVLPWNRDADARDRVSRSESPHGHSAVRMLTVEPNEFDLPPMAKRRVLVSGAASADLHAEAYAAVTGFRRDVDLADDDMSLARRSCLVRIMPADALPSQARIAGHATPYLGAAGLIFEATVENTGPTGFGPDVTLTVRDAQGAAIDRVTEPAARTTLVQAGGSRRILFDWTRILTPGDYESELLLRYDPNLPALTHKNRFRITETNAIEPLPAAFQLDSGVTE